MSNSGKNKTMYLVAGLGALGLAAYMISKGAKQGSQASSSTTYPNGKYTVRGYRNNNPLNLVYSAKNNWLGQIVPSTDGRFCQFTDMKYGYRAALLNMRSYINGGTNTVRKIITKWAPATENNTSGYIQNVVNWSGVPADAVLTAKDARLKNIVSAMSQVENGKNIAVPTDSLQAGWNLYLATV